MGNSFWEMGEGPNQWAAALRWLCFSDNTLPLAVREANRVLRQLSMGGFPAVQAACTTAFEVMLQAADLPFSTFDQLCDDQLICESTLLQHRAWAG